MGRLVPAASRVTALVMKLSTHAVEKAGRVPDEPGPGGVRVGPTRRVNQQVRGGKMLNKKVERLNRLKG